MDKISIMLGCKESDIDYKDIQYEELDNSDIMIGDKNPMKDPETYKVWKKIVRSEEYRKRMSEIKTGFKHSEETKTKMSLSAKAAGTGLWVKGIGKTEETRKRMSDSHMKKERVPCSKCGNTYTKANIRKHERACNGKSI